LTLLFGDSVGEVESLAACLLLVVLHVADQSVCLPTTAIVPLLQQVVGIAESSVAGVDLGQVSKLVCILRLHLFQKVFELLEFFHLV